MTFVCHVISVRVQSEKSNKDVKCFDIRQGLTRILGYGMCHTAKRVFQSQVPFFPRDKRAEPFTVDCSHCDGTAFKSSLTR